MIANVLIAIAGQDIGMSQEAAARYKKTIDNVKKTYRDKLLHSGRDDIGIGRVDFVSTRAEVDTYLSKGLYDIFLCTDRLTGEKEGIGIGTIRQWSEKFPNVHTFLLLEPKRDKETNRLMNSGKLANLYLEGYYVALFVNEIVANEEEFYHVLVNGRTKDEAYQYYELNDEIVGRILENKIRKKPVDISSMKESAEYTDIQEENTYQENLFEEASQNDEEIASMEEDIPEYEAYNGSYSPRLYLDLDALSATAAYSFGGIIGEIISDEVLIIRCPNGGLFRNKDSLKDHRVDVVIKDL